MSAMLTKCVSVGPEFYRSENVFRTLLDVLQAVEALPASESQVARCLDAPGIMIHAKQTSINKGGSLSCAKSQTNCTDGKSPSIPACEKGGSLEHLHGYSVVLVRSLLEQGR
jgi:hypothetical protein